MRRILRLEDVSEMTSLSKSTILRYEQEGIFPKHIQLGKRCIAWDGDEINEWIEEQKSRSLNSPFNDVQRDESKN